MSKKLYVGNLPYSTTNDQLKKLFEQTGVVESVNIIMDKFSGRSKGFGFIEMSTEEEAQEAIKKFNGYQLDERAMVVNEARPMEERRSVGGGNRNFNRRNNY